MEIGGGRRRRSEEIGGDRRRSEEIGGDRRRRWAGRGGQGRWHLGGISAASRRHLGGISAASRRHLGGIRGRRSGEMGGAGRSTAVGLLKNWKSSPRRSGGRRSTPPHAPAARSRTPHRTPGDHVACRALRRALTITSRARAAAFPHGMRVVALGVVSLWGLGASKSVRAGGSSTDRNEGVLRRAGGVRGGLGAG